MDNPKLRRVAVATVAIMALTAGSYALWNENNLPAAKQHVVETPIEATASYSAPQEANTERIIVRTHKVISGETLSSIAQHYDVDVDTIIGANPGTTELILPGSEISILPEKGVLHTAVKSETLWGIARRYGVSLQRIIEANNKLDSSLIIGEKIFVPGAKPGIDAITVSRGFSRITWPATGTISSPFGYRWGRLHAGVDIANDTGTAIYAAANGRVLFSGWESGYGYLVIIDHGNGSSSLYGHLSDYLVSKNEPVRAGQLIAYMGNTGNSTGSHLHFEVRQNGIPIDPQNLFP